MQLAETQQIILSAVRKAQQNEVSYETLYENPASGSFKNEFLFFLKPELTAPLEGVKLAEIVRLALERIEHFGLTIRNIKILAADYLDRFNIIAQHYGVINKLANDPLNAMSESAKEKFQTIYGKPISEATVMGGFQFLARYDQFTPFALDVLWQNIENQKLAGGTYCEKIKVDADTIYLIDGFHPRQLTHFTQPGRSIVIFTLAGDLDWQTARQDFIGATNPTKAPAGSIRRDLYDRQAELGLPEVSQGLNGVHLSAGPIEGLVELVRYNANFSDAANSLSYNDFALGHLLSNTFSADQVDMILSNKDVQVEGKSVSMFDLTEEKNSDEAIELLKQYL